MSVVLFLSSCDDFLDKNPDNRAVLNATTVKDLLVSAYPDGNYSVLGEILSDNIIDNNNHYASIGESPRLSSRSRMHDELFMWEPVVSSSSTDSPNGIWAPYYKAIAVANHALEAIDLIEAEGTTEDLSPWRGEALLCRAYAHFILVNVFSQTYKNEEASKLDLGIPYATEPERDVFVKYERGTVTDVYKKIEEDLVAGFPLIKDAIYQHPKYRFNKKAAAAFAARFYLFKRDYEKVVHYANIVLGDDPTPFMRDWSPLYVDGSAFGYAYIDVNNPANLLLLATHSRMDEMWGGRYGHFGTASSGALSGAGPTWAGKLPVFSKSTYVAPSSSTVYTYLLYKQFPMFEFTDRVAQIGYWRSIRTEFTIEETLLCRAEAYVYLNRLDLALKDLEVWNAAHLCEELTDAKIRAFYTAGRTLYVKRLRTEAICPDFVISSEQKPYIDCVLHFRRLENLFDGTRWFDNKRYAMEIEHRVGEEDLVLRMEANDPRWAVQLPTTVISAGLEPNPER